MTIAAKALMALGILGLGGTGIWAVKKYLFDNILSEHEYAMINYLSEEDNDIVFDVKKGENADQELTANDITFSNEQPEKVTVSAIVQVSGNSSSSFKKKNSDATINDPEMSEIKAINGGNWTWKCMLTFSRGDDKTTQTIKSDYKDRIFKESDKGLFGILKKNLSNYTNGESNNKWTKEELKNVKRNFVIYCGTMGTWFKGRQTSDSGVTISVNPEFSFKKVENGSDLVPTSENWFSRWFEQKYATKEYHTSN